jgi:hypothetical protein
VSTEERLPWEYASGPAVGEDIPLTGEPRRTLDQEASGGRHEQPTGNANGHSDADGTEVREVRSEDPDLSPETNRELTRELREVVGAERVRVPVDRPHITRGEDPPHLGVGDYLSMHRFQLVRATAIALTFGAIIALITNDWWLLPLAAGIHALGTMIVAITIVGMTTNIEHPAPEVAAAMAEEGVSNPDERFSRMVDEFRPQPERDAQDVISPGANERTQDALTSPQGAAVEQSSSMTPTGAPSRPSGEGGLPDLVIWGVIFGLFVLTVVIPPLTGGGWMWLLTAVMIPLLIAWGLSQWLLSTRQPHLSRGYLLAVAPCTAVAVAGFCAVVAVGFQH